MKRGRAASCASMSCPPDTAPGRVWVGSPLGGGLRDLWGSILRSASHLHGAPAVQQRRVELPRDGGVRAVAHRHVLAVRADEEVEERRAARVVRRGGARLELGIAQAVLREAGCAVCAGARALRQLLARAGR